MKLKDHFFRVLLIAFLSIAGHSSQNCGDIVNELQQQSFKHTLMERVNLSFTELDSPGYTRKIEQGFEETFTAPNGREVRAVNEVKRLKSFKIPPAWQDVWISSNPRSHIQVVGVDRAGRKQYIYHQDWELVRKELKRKVVYEFGKGIFGLRKQIKKDLRKNIPAKEKAIATLLATMDLTYIRVGSPKYSLENNTYGLSTLLKSHTQIEGNKVTFDFVGKSNKEHVISFKNSVIAKNISEMNDYPGEQLFQYKNERGGYLPINPTEINSYLKKISEQDISAKNFRTWHASRIAIEYLLSGKPLGNEYSELYKFVASHLRNTPAVTKSSYVDPVIVKIFEKDPGFKLIQESLERENTSLSISEEIFMKILYQRLNP